MVKFTVELPPTLIRRLAEHEVAATRAAGRRQPQDRVISAALAAIPDDGRRIARFAGELPEELAAEPVVQKGTRVPQSLRERLAVIGPTLRMEGSRVPLKRVYAAAVWRFLEAESRSLGTSESEAS